MKNRSYFIIAISLFLHFGIIKLGNAQTNPFFLHNNKTDTIADIQHFNNQITHLPLPQYPSNSSGIVAVEVWVNQKGKVVKAIHDVTQSTTTDAKLIKSSLKAAKKAEFIPIENDTIRVGSITYKFTKL